MDISEIELEFLKDIWADTSRREIAKRAIAIALSRAAKYTLLGDVMELGAELDRMLLPEEQEPRDKDKNLTI
jgi:hypothetical protein